jgi:hypothetical protein
MYPQISGGENEFRKQRHKQRREQRRKQLLKTASKTAPKTNFANCAARRGENATS